MEWQGKPEPRPDRSEWDADGFGSPSWDDGFDGSFRQKGSYGGYRASSGGYGGGGGSHGGRSGGYGGGGSSSWQRSSASSGGSPSVGRSYSGTGVGRPGRPSPARSASPAGKSAPKAAAVEFQTGDRVEHSAFGQGTVLSVTPMGGDALMEVQFGDIRKKLMWKTAGAHMKKV